MLQCKNNTLNIQNIVANLYQRILSDYIQQTTRERLFNAILMNLARKKKINFTCTEFIYLFIYMQGSKNISYPFLLVWTRHSCRRCKIRSYIGESSRTLPPLRLSPEHRPSLLLLKQTNYINVFMFLSKIIVK